GGDLVADRVAKNRWMRGALANAVTHAPLDDARRATTIEKRNVLLPRNTQHYAQASILCQVEQPARRDGISTDGVEAVTRHLFKVARDNLRVAVFAGVRPGRGKRAIGHAAHVELCKTDGNEFPQYRRTQ